MPKVAKFVDFLIHVPNEPGELYRITKGLKDAQVNLHAIWATGMGGGQAGEIIVVPEDPDEFRDHAEEAALQIEERTVVHVTGKDELGALVDTVERIASADINVYALDAIALNGKFGAYCWVADEDRDELERLLGA